MTDPRTERGTVPSLAEFRRFMTLSMDICPNCSAEIGEGMCCMTYTEWHCWGCGARLDSRVVSPRSVMRCENERPDYTPRLGEPQHPLACSCAGRGWYEWGSPEAAESGRSLAVSEDNMPKVVEYDLLARGGGNGSESIAQDGGVDAESLGGVSPSQSLTNGGLDDGSQVGVVLVGRSDECSDVHAPSSHTAEDFGREGRSDD